MSQQYSNDESTGFQNHVKHVAILGAGGHVGKPIAEALISLGKHKVTAISRSSSQTKLPGGLDGTRQIDFDDHATVVSALKGQDVFIITLPVTAAPDTQMKLVDAAVEAGVKYIMPNEWGIDIDHEGLANETSAGDGPKKVRQYIQDIGGDRTHWIALATGSWYEHSLAIPDAFGFDFDNKRVTLFDDGTAKVSNSTWKRAGEAVARLLALKIVPEDAHDKDLTLNQLENRSAFVDSFAISQRDMFESVLRVLGTEESDWTVSHENSQDRYNRGLEKFKVGEYVSGHVLKLYSRLFFPNGGGDFSQKIVNDKLGLPREGLDEATTRALQLVRGGYRYGPGSN